MSFDIYFRASSYAMVACGALALAVAGGMGWSLALLFAVLLGSRGDSRGRVGNCPSARGWSVVCLRCRSSISTGNFNRRRLAARSARTRASAALDALHAPPLRDQTLPGKSDRDWLFLYLISFFEVLLAAGLSVSPHFLGCARPLSSSARCSTIVASSCGRRARAWSASAGDAFCCRGATSRLCWRAWGDDARRGRDGARRDGVLPVVAFCLLALIFALALPIFFITPRCGASALALRRRCGSTGMVGFSDQVTLGDIGRLQTEQPARDARAASRARSRAAAGARWRGVALDHFDGRTWRRSSAESRVAHGRRRAQPLPARHDRGP